MAYDPNADTLTREPEPEEQPSQYDVAFQNDFNRRFLPSQGGYGGQPTGLPTTQAFTQPYAQPIPTRPAPEQPGALPRTALPTPTPRYRTLSLDEARDATPGETYGHSGVSDESRERGFFGDLWTTIQHGGGGALEGVLGAARYFEDKVGADPSTKAWTDQQRDNVSQWMDKLLEEGSPSLKRGLSASMFGGVDAQGNHIPTPGEVGYLTYMRANVINLIPDIAMTLLPAALVGRLAIKAMSLVGAATKIARGAGVAGEMGTFGLQNMGEQYNSAVETLKNTPEATMMQSPAYAEMRRGGYSDTEAKELLKKQAIDPMMLEAALVGAAAGQGAMSLAARGVLGKLGGKGRLLGAVVGGGEGAALMGGQGGANVAIGQQFQQGIGTRQEFDQGAIARGVASGALTGAVIGAAGGALHPVRPEAPQVRPPEGVPPDAAAALGEALGPPPPPPPPAFDPTTPGQGMLPGMSGQGEMFTEGQAGAGQAPREPAIAGVQPGLPPEAQQGGLFDPTTQVRPPAPTQGEMFPREPPPPNTPVEPPPAAPRGGGGAAPPESTPPVTPGVKPQAPGERPSKGKTKSEMVDVLVGEYGASPTQLKNMSPNDVATRYDREERRKAASTPTPPTSTVESGVPASRPERSEGLVPPRETVAPPVPETSLPSAPATERPSTAQADLEARMRSSAETLRKTRETVAAGPTEEELATLVDTKQSGKTTEAPVPVEEPAVEKPAATVSKGRKKQPTVIIPEKKAGPQAYVEREEGAPAPSAEELQTDRAKELARSQARDDVEVARKAAMGLLPPSTPIGKAIDKASSDLANLIHRGSDGSRENLVDILHKFTEPVDKRTELEQQAREKLADHYHRKLMGERLVTRTGDEPTRSEASVVREEEQKRGKVDKPTSAEGIEETAVGGGEGESAGLTMALDTKNKPVTVAHVQERKAADYINKVLDPTDPMTVEQAQAEFDKKGTVGRPRNADAASLAAAFDAEIKRVSNPLLAETHQKQLDAHLLAGAKKDMPGAKQKPQTAEAAKEAREKYAERTKILEDRLAQVAPERIAALKEARARIVDPVGTVANEAEAMATRAAFREKLAKRGGETLEDAPEPAPPRPDGISPRSSRYVISGSQDTRMDTGLLRAMRASEANGVPFTSHDLLRYVAQDPLVRNELMPYRMLATQLLKHAPDIPILTPEHAHDTGAISYDRYKYLKDRGVYGSYDPGEGHIILNIDRDRLTGTHMETGLHEIMHSITYDYINRLMNSNKLHPDLMALEAIRRELARHLDAEHAADRLTDAEKRRVAYALSNIHELHTQLMTDPIVQGFAAARMATPALREALAKYGFAPREQGRSVWRYFTDWMRRALRIPTPASASEYTMLDHLLRPMTEITDRAIQFNKDRILPKDPGLRDAAGPVYDGITSTIAARGQDMLRRTDPAGFGDRMRRYMLRVSNRDAVVDWNKDILPSLLNYRTADENIRAGSNTFAGKYGDKVQELAGRINKADNKNGLGNLMTDVGIHDVSVGSALAADANSHLTTDAQRAARDRLQGQYDALSAKDKTTYDEVKKLYNDMYTDERHAQAEALINGFMPKATDEQRAAFTTVVKSRTSLEKFLADPNNSRVAEAFGADWGTSRAVAINLAKLHDMGFVRGDYFPLRRFGNYVVRYGDKTDPANYGVEMFESYKKAQERRAELAKDRDDVMQVSRKDNTPLADLASRPALADELESSMRRAGMDAAHIDHVTNMMNDILLRHATHSEAARARMARKGVRGASVDHTRVLASDFVSRQARYGYLLHGLDRARRLNEMHDEARAHEGPTGVPGAAVRAMNVYEEMVRRQTQPGDHDNLAYKISATANAFSFAQSLQSVSHMLTGTMETHGNSLALLGARHGYTRTVIALSKAMADASPVIKGGAVNTIKALGNRLKMSDWNLVKAVVEEMASKPGANRAAIMALGDELVRTGLIDHTQLQDIRQQMNPADLVGTGANKVWNIFYNSHAAMAHAVDVMNKLAVAKAAYDLELRKSGDHKVARDYAIQMTRRVMPNYTVGNRAGIAQGPLASSLLQFKRYGMHMYALMANLIHETARGPNKVESAKALAGILATHAAMAGVLTLIADPLRYIGGGIDILNRRAKFHDYQNDVRGFLTSTLGPTMGEIAARGLPHALGMDLHRRVGLSNLLEVPEMNGFNKEGAAQVLLGLATGATGENLQNLVDGVGKLTHGDWGGFLKAAAPRPFRDVYKGIDAATEGIKDKTGKVILPASRVGVTGGILQGLGIQPAAVSEFREGRNAVLEAREEQRSEHTDLVNRWLAASPTDRAAIMTKIRQFNANPMNQGARITMDSLIRTQQQRRKDENQAGGFGLRLPKVGARQLMQAGAFANVQ